MCNNFHLAQVFILNTRPDEIWFRDKAEYFSLFQACKACAMSEYDMSGRNQGLKQHMCGQIMSCSQTRLVCAPLRIKDTMHPELWTLNPAPSSRNSKPCTHFTQPWTPDPKHSTPNPTYVHSKTQTLSNKRYKREKKGEKKIQNEKKTVNNKQWSLSNKQYTLNPGPLHPKPKPKSADSCLSPLY